jgi:hypothetical protein
VVSVATRLVASTRGAVIDSTECLVKYP